MACHIHQVLNMIKNKNFVKDSLFNGTNVSLVIYVYIDNSLYFDIHCGSTTSDNLWCEVISE